MMAFKMARNVKTKIKVKVTYENLTDKVISDFNKMLVEKECKNERSN